MILNKTTNVLVIGDLHAPFIHKDYLQHCKEAKNKYKCNKIIMIGDLIDNNFSSFHEIDPDGYSAKNELEYAIDQLKPWYKEFPEAEILIGNHDRMIMRKAAASGISNVWIKDFKDVISTPKWNFHTSYVFDNVMYIHGDGAINIVQTILNSRLSTVAGHAHTKFEIIYNASEKDLLFGMHVGAGIDIKSFAFNYAKYNTKRTILGCGVVLNNGKLPLLLPMKL